MGITFLPLMPCEHKRRKYLCSGSIHVPLQEGLVRNGSHLCEQSSHLCSVLAHWDQWKAAPCEKGGTYMFRLGTSLN